MGYPSKQTAELMKWAKKHGCVYRGIAKSGHVQIALPDGTIYVTAASPSDVNSWKAAQRDIARRLGVPVPSSQSGHYRKGTRRRGFSMRDALLGRRSNHPDVYTVGAPEPVEREPIGLIRLRADEQRLARLYEKTPTGVLEVQLRDVRARIREGLF